MKRPMITLDEYLMGISDEEIAQKYGYKEEVNESRNTRLESIINECVDRCLRKCLKNRIQKDTLNEALIKNNPFKKWFGDWENDPQNASKVVDKNGRPLIVYHGTTIYQDGQPFTEFKYQKEGWNGGTNSTGYFTDSLTVANFFANAESNSELRMNSVSKLFQEINPNTINDCIDFLNQYIYGDAKLIVKPFSIREGDKTIIGVPKINGKDAVILRYYMDDKYNNVALCYEDEGELVVMEKLKKYIHSRCNLVDRSRKLESDYQKHGVVYPCYLKIKKPFVYDAKGKRHSEIDWGEIDNVAISKGCDGVIIRNVVETTVGYSKCTDYKVFSPNQIKHAYDNVDFTDSCNILR